MRQGCSSAGETQGNAVGCSVSSQRHKDIATLKSDLGHSDTDPQSITPCLAFTSALNVHFKQLAKLLTTLLSGVRSVAGRHIDSALNSSNNFDVTLEAEA